MAGLSPAPEGGRRPEGGSLCRSRADGSLSLLLLENIALTFSTASNVGVIVSASPLFVALLTLLLSRGRERPRWSFLLGFVVSMAGICLISFNGSQLALDVRGGSAGGGRRHGVGGLFLLTKRIGGYGWNVIQTTRRIFGWGSCSCSRPPD